MQVFTCRAESSCDAMISTRNTRIVLCTCTRNPGIVPEDTLCNPRSSPNFSTEGTNAKVGRCWVLDSIHTYNEKNPRHYKA
ncbi:unnamed protein product [Lasius platythorax]|uniref:Uncharacterized protein n=1 Tax=Lasius platythorax TaxID=488582 RepID=A0AAV2P2R7_9HYME